jgi:hypothetical protein
MKTMTPEELEEWARKELPPYSTKNVHPEYIKEATKDIIEDIKTNWLRLCRCSICKRMLLNIRFKTTS